MYKIVFSKKAEKFLSKLNQDDRDRILATLDRLRIRPLAYIKKLVDSEEYRFRVGDYRVILELHEKEIVVLVLRISHRRNAYKK